MSDHVPTTNKQLQNVLIRPKPLPPKGFTVLLFWSERGVATSILSVGHLEAGIMNNLHIGFYKSMLASGKM